MNVRGDISGTLLCYHIITPALYISPPPPLPPCLHLMSDIICSPAVLLTASSANYKHLNQISDQNLLGKKRTDDQQKKH